MKGYNVPNQSVIDFGTGFLDFGAGVEAVQSLWKNILTSAPVLYGSIAGMHGTALRSAPPHQLGREGLTG